jgi:hypothetical protein
METESPGRAPNRPRPWLLVALAVVGLVFAVWVLWPGNSADPAAASSKPRVAAKTGTSVEAIQPSDLDVRLEALEQKRPAAADGDRNPFRFYVKPPPPPPPVTEAPPTPVLRPVPTVPPPDPGPPPIPLKFIGVLEAPKVGKLAVFSDCRVTMRGREGEIIDGRYRLVRIGVESVVMEYVDGRGRITIRMSGQDCVGK